MVRVNSPRSPFQGVPSHVLPFCGTLSLFCRAERFYVSMASSAAAATWNHCHSLANVALAARTCALPAVHCLPASRSQAILPCATDSSSCALGLHRITAKASASLRYSSNEAFERWGRRPTATRHQSFQQSFGNRRTYLACHAVGTIRGYSSRCTGEIPRKYGRTLSPAEAASDRIDPDTQESSADRGGASNDLRSSDAKTVLDCMPPHATRVCPPFWLLRCRSVCILLFDCVNTQSCCATSRQ